MPEWLKGMDCKSISLTYAGSNPARPNQFFLVEQSSTQKFKMLLDRKLYIYYLSLTLNDQAVLRFFIDNNKYQKFVIALTCAT